MSLLDKATIITTPTAHSNGKLHSIKGGSVADFDVVRGSAATRVNAEGLIEDISIIGGELVTNGDFSNGSTGWALNPNWSLGGLGVVADGSSNGTIWQAGVLEDGKTYQITYTLTDFLQGTLSVSVSGSIGEVRTTAGTYTEILTAGTSPTTRVTFQGTSSFKVTLSNISVKEVIDATNIPRIDYTTGEGVILTEPQSTNLVSRSNRFDDGTYYTYTGTTTIEANSSTSPSGSVDAYNFIPETLDERHILRAPVTASGLTTTLSVFAKPNGYNYLSMSTIYSANSEGAGIIIDLTDGSTFATKVGGTTSFTVKVDDYADGWKKISFSVTQSTSNSDRIFFGAFSGGSYTWNNGTISPVFAGNGTDGVLFFGAQLEELSYSTSYIPTSGAIATRLADSVTGAGDSSTFNSTEGVLYAEIRALADDLNIEGISISDGSISNRVVIFKWNSSNTIRARVSANGVNVLNQLISLTNITDFNKIAISYKLNDFKVYVNGTNVFSDTSGVTPIGLNTISFSTDGTSSAPFYGKTKTIAVFSEALTDGELTCLTTI